MILLAIILLTFGLVIVAPVLVGVSLRHGVKYPFLVKCGAALFLYGFLASCGSAGHIQQFNSSAEAWGNLTGLLLPFIVGDALMLRGVFVAKKKKAA